MTLYMMGLGLEDEKSISLKALEKIKLCNELYLENYTSILQVQKSKLEKLYNKKIILADRELIESNFSNIILKAKKENIALLIPGDVFSATTHISIFQEAKENNVKIEIYNNASVLTAVGITGLELYKFGRTASIPFDNSKIITPVTILKDNQKSNLHTLFLLDLNPKENKFLTIKEAIEYLEKNKVSSKEKALACARLGCKDYLIKSGALSDLKSKDYGKPPYCLIMPSKLHFIEEEMFNSWK